MKKIQIQIIVGEDKMAKMINLDGFEEGDILARLELIGIYESLKQGEMEKIKTLMTKKVKKDESFSKDDNEI